MKENDVSSDLFSNPMGFLAAGGLVTLVVSMWSKIKGIAWRGIGLLIQRVEIPTESAHDAVVAFLINKYKRSRNYDRMYGATWEYQRDGRYGLIPYEVFGSRTLILWNGWFPFLFSNQQEKKHATSKNTSGEAPSGVAKVHSTITYFRGTLNVEQILRDACDVRNQLSWTVEGRRGREEEPLRDPLHPAARRHRQRCEFQRRPLVVPAGKLPPARPHAGATRKEQRLQRECA